MGAQVTCRRGGKEKKRPKEKIKIVEERPEYLTTRGQIHRDTHTDEDIEVDINLTLEEENPRDDVEGVGHPKLIQNIDIIDEEDETNNVDSEEEFNDAVGITDEAQDRPDLPGDVDSEEEFNDAVEITDETVDRDDLPGETERPDEGNNILREETKKKKKQPSPRERRRTRSMAVAEKKKTPIKEKWTTTR